MTPETLGLAAMLYVALMFLLAHAADRAAARGRWRWMDRPVIYTLSLSIYCSAWTFYGAVGYATRSGLEFLTIYLGPGIVFAGAWWGLRRLVRVARLRLLRVQQLRVPLPASFWIGAFMVCGGAILCWLATRGRAA